MCTLMQHPGPRPSPHSIVPAAGWLSHERPASTCDWFLVSRAVQPVGRTLSRRTRVSRSAAPRFERAEPCVHDMLLRPRGTSSNRRDGGGLVERRTDCFRPTRDPVVLPTPSAASACSTATLLLASALATAALTARSSNCLLHTLLLRPVAGANVPAPLSLSGAMPFVAVSSRPLSPDFTLPTVSFFLDLVRACSASASA